MNTDMTAETEVRCTDSATVRTDRSSWSWHSSSVSASMTIAGYLLGWWFEALQTSDVCRTPQFSVTCQFVKNSLWDITFPEQTSATLVGRRVSGQVAVRRIVDDGEAAWTAHVWQGPASRVASGVKDTQQTRCWSCRVFLYVFSCATSEYQECFVGNGYGVLPVPWHVGDMESSSHNHIPVVELISRLLCKQQLWWTVLGCS